MLALSSLPLGLLIVPSELLYAVPALVNIGLRRTHSTIDPTATPPTVMLLPDSREIAGYITL